MQTGSKHSYYMKRYSLLIFWIFVFRESNKSEFKAVKLEDDLCSKRTFM